jgi:hypothetical protein
MNSELLLELIGQIDDSIVAEADKVIFKSKPVKSKRILLVAAVIAVIIALSGIALATFTDYSFGRIFSSFFNNPAAEEHRVEGGQSVYAGGLEISMLSAFVDNNNAYILIEIRDIEGNRLSGSVIALAENVEGLASDVVQYDESENTVTMVLTLFLGGPINEGDVISFPIGAILTEPRHLGVNENAILGPWEISFVVSTEMPTINITVFPADSPFLTELEIEITPMTTTILKQLQSAVQVGDVADYIDSFGEPFLSLDDGRVIALEPTGSIFDSEIGWGGYASVFFDIDMLYSITFCGEEYVFGR